MVKEKPAKDDHVFAPSDHMEHCVESCRCERNPAASGETTHICWLKSRFPIRLHCQLSIRASCKSRLETACLECRGCGLWKICKLQSHQDDEKSLAITLIVNLKSQMCSKKLDRYKGTGLMSCYFRSFFLLHSTWGKFAAAKAISFPEFANREAGKF